MTRIAILSEGLPGDLRPIAYSRSTWDVPFLGRPLLAAALEWLERIGCHHVFLLDDTPGLWLDALSARCPVAIPTQHVDARREPSVLVNTLAPLLKPLAPTRVYLVKPCAMFAPDIDALETFHESNSAQASFALTRLEPGSLSWTHIPACRMDEHGAILEVDKLRRSDTLGSATLENVLGATAPSRPREFWAPRNLGLLEPDLAYRLPISELLAPLSGLARHLAADGVACYGRAMKGTWWPASSTLEVMAANREALRALGGNSNRLDGASHIDSDASVSDAAEVQASVISSGAEIASNAIISGSVIDAQTRIGEGTSVKDSLLTRGASLPSGIPLTGAVIGLGEVQNLVRGVPPGGFFLDGTRAVNEAAVLSYWRDSVPLYGRDPNAAIVETLARGLENNVYHIADGSRQIVLKRRLDCNAHPLIREFHVMRVLQGRQVAPHPHALDLRPEIPVAPCIVMDYVSGQRVPDGGITPDIARGIARTCLAVHGTPIHTLVRDLPELSEQAYTDLRAYVTDLVFQYGAWLEVRQQTGLGDDALGQQVGALVGWLLEHAERENEHWTGYVPRALCQGDLREFNMVVCDDNVVLLDWERCGIDDPAYDIAWFLALGNLSSEAEDAFRETYGPGLGGDLSFWKRVEAFRVANELTWPIHLVELARNVRDGQTPAADPEARALTYENDALRALARAFTTLARLDGPEVFAPCTADDVRTMGPLFG